MSADKTWARAPEKLNAKRTIKQAGAICILLK